MTSQTATLRSAGSCLVLDLSGDGLPTVLHWGADLPEAVVAELPGLVVGPVPNNALDEPWQLTVLNVAHELVTVLVMALIIGVWPA